MQDTSLTPPCMPWQENKLLDLTCLFWTKRQISFLPSEILSINQFSALKKFSHTICDFTSDVDGMKKIRVSFEDTENYQKWHFEASIADLRLQWSQICLDMVRNLGFLNYPKTEATNILFKAGPQNCAQNFFCGKTVQLLFPQKNNQGNWRILHQRPTVGQTATRRFGCRATPTAACSGFRSDTTTMSRSKVKFAVSQCQLGTRQQTWPVKILPSSAVSLRIFF